MASSIVYTLWFCTIALPWFDYVQSQVDVEPGSYTVCQKFKGNFAPFSSHRTETMRGLPGKMGPKGDKGGLGNIEESEIVQNLARELRVINDCQGPVIGGTCYYLLEVKVDHVTAISECHKSNGKLASITSRQLYGVVYRLVYDRIVAWQSSAYLQFWIDGKYQNGGVTLSNGDKMPFLLWYPNYPRTGASEIYMAFEINKVTTTTNQHMFNIRGTHVAYPVCQHI